MESDLLICFEIIGNNFRNYLLLNDQLKNNPLILDCLAFAIDLHIWNELDFFAFSSHLISSHNVLEEYPECRFNVWKFVKDLGGFEYLFDNYDFMLRLQKLSRYNIFFASERLNKDPKFVQHCIWVNLPLPEHIHNHVRNDPEISEKINRIYGGFLHFNLMTLDRVRYTESQSFDYNSLPLEKRLKDKNILRAIDLAEADNSYSIHLNIPNDYKPSSFMYNQIIKRKIRYNLIPKVIQINPKIEKFYTENNLMILSNEPFRKFLKY